VIDRSDVAVALRRPDPHYRGVRVDPRGSFRVDVGLEEDNNDLSPAAAPRISGQPLYDQFGDPLLLHEPFSTTTRITANVGAGYTF
jgi:hypothetical protein